MDQAHPVEPANVEAVTAAMTWMDRHADDGPHTLDVLGESIRLRLYIDDWLMNWYRDQIPDYWPKPQPTYVTYTYP